MIEKSSRCASSVYSMLMNEEHHKIFSLLLNVLFMDLVTEKSLMLKVYWNGKVQKFNHVLGL